MHGLHPGTLVSSPLDGQSEGLRDRAHTVDL